jgi:hypothetical protein
MGLRLAHWEQHALANGRKRMDNDDADYRGSDFAYRSTWSAGLVVDFADGARITDRKEPSALVEILNRGYGSLKLAAVLHCLRQRYVESEDRASRSVPDQQRPGDCSPG